MSQIHPRPNDNGQPVTISNPSTPTPLSAFDNPGMIATVVPDGKIPDRLSGIAFRSWVGAPTSALAWLSVPGQADFTEPTMTPKPGKKFSAGVVTVEPDGRVWAIAPTNAFGGYNATFPKGRLDTGMTSQASAIKEVFEESGLQVEITDLVGDFERSTTVTRYYLARRLGGNPVDMGWESQAVLLIPQDMLFTVLDHPNDQPLITKVLAMLATREH